MTDLTAAWLEWRELCELDKCSPKHITQLCSASNGWFRWALQRLPQGTACIEQLSSLLPDTDGETGEMQERNEFRRTFRLMECELLPPGEKPERQQFKDRIFKQAPSTGDVTGYFLKSFFRSYVKKKENLSYLLPELPEDAPPEAGEIQQYEYERRYGTGPEQKTPDRFDEELIPIVREFWAGLTERERAALYTFHYHMTMSDERLLEKVGCGKSVFLDIPTRKLNELVVLAREKYQITERSDYSLLCVEVLPVCYDEWEKESELGRWIVEHTRLPDEPGAKVRFQ